MFNVASIDNDDRPKPEDQYSPPSWVIWCLDRDHKTRNGDPIQNAILLAQSNLAEVQKRIAWLESGAKGWVNKGSTYVPTGGRSVLAENDEPAAGLLLKGHRNGQAG
jgi:hypothetical protein